MNIFLFFSILQLFAIKSIISQFCETNTDNDECSERTKLFRIGMQQVGESQQITVSGTQMNIKAVSAQPALFEIEDFLSKDECEYLINLAHREGLKESETKPHTQRSGVKLRDLNSDRRLTLDEMMLTVEDSFDIYPTESDILKLYHDLKMDTNQDSVITPEELNLVDPGELSRYWAQFSRDQPAKRSRHSKQVWLYPDKSTDPVFKQIQQKVQELTGLDPVLITKSDFQVVNYGVAGHYNAHHDSGKVDPSVPCCTRVRTSQCRICRFATVLMYLNDVEEGGETAFPVADNETLDSARFISTHQMNLMRYCDGSNVKVTPRLGKAVLWYNHHVDAETGWLGALDEYSWHGGCPVTRGNKWIANFWIKVTDDPVESLAPTWN